MNRGRICGPDKSDTDTYLTRDHHHTRAYPFSGKKKLRIADYGEKVHWNLNLA